MNFCSLFGEQVPHLLFISIFQPYALLEWKNENQTFLYPKSETIIETTVKAAL